jgi:hypothetical protein
MPRLGLRPERVIPGHEPTVEGVRSPAGRWAIGPFAHAVPRRKFPLPSTVIFRVNCSPATTRTATKEQDSVLLALTMVLYGTNMGNANTHVTTNLPVLLAAGAFRHGQHLAIDRANNYPLPNLFESMLHRLGIQAERFATSMGAMAGLEMHG